MQLSSVPWGEFWNVLVPPSESLRVLGTATCRGAEGDALAYPTKLPLLQRRTGVDNLESQKKKKSDLGLTNKCIKLNSKKPNKTPPKKLNIGGSKFCMTSCGVVCMLGHRPWWAILFGRLKVQLHPLVVLDLSGDWDRQWVNMVSTATTIIAPMELSGSGKSREKSRKFWENVQSAGRW